MTQKNWWKTLAAVVLMIIITFAYGLIDPQEHGEPPTHLPIILGGYRFNIPLNYIPWRERPRGPYPYAMDLQAARLTVTWPSMEPFVDPEDNSPVAIRSRNELGILIDRSFVQVTDLKKQRHWFFKSTFEEWMGRGTHVKLDNRYGLQRYVDRRFIGKTINEIESIPELSKAYGLASLWADDLYVSPSVDKMETIIQCMPETEPDPFSEEANRRKQEEKLVRNPMCQQNFYFPEKNLYIKLSYMRVHLPEWRRIQDRVITLLRSFATNAEMGIPVPSQPKK